MPLSLNDDEFAAVQAAAAPIHRLQRSAFLKALALELEKYPGVIGLGVVFRLCVDLQKRYVIAPERQAPLATEPRHLRARQAGG
jgi:hypothetical protein